MIATQLADVIQKLTKQNISLNEVQYHLYSPNWFETISEAYLQRMQASASKTLAT